MERRTALKSIASLTAAVGLTGTAIAQTINKHTVHETGLAKDALPPVFSGGLAFFTKQEAATVGAVFDRLIPADELSIGAVEAGCVQFTDHQLAGDFGRAAAQYREGPFRQGTPEQGDQGRQTPAERYRQGLAALDIYCEHAYGKGFVALDAATQDAVLTALEKGSIALTDTDGKAFFNLMLQNVREGFLADPIYGGNKDMAGWKMVGFPGARYDFRDVVDRRGQVLNIVPTSLIDR